jgi:hypothetical protein
MKKCNQHEDRREKGTKATKYKKREGRVVAEYLQSKFQISVHSYLCT